jgi:hypothetical protein
VWLVLLSDGSIHIGVSLYACYAQQSVPEAVPDREQPISQSVALRGGGGCCTAVVNESMKNSGVGSISTVRRTNGAYTHGVWRAARIV